MTPTCPLTHAQTIDAYFMEHRAKIIDIAAFLDRLDRTRDAGGDDFRMAALRRAIGLLIDGKPERARRVLELFSDPTAEPVPAAGLKGAYGAYQA